MHLNDRQAFVAIVAQSVTLLVIVFGVGDIYFYISVSFLYMRWMLLSTSKQLCLQGVPSAKIYAVWTWKVFYRLTNKMCWIVHLAQAWSQLHIRSTCMLIAYHRQRTMYMFVVIHSLFHSIKHGSCAVLTRLKWFARLCTMIGVTVFIYLCTM